jgi:bifunctional non-homologous end joining protein LigD
VPGKHQVELSRPDKPLFEGISKADLAGYYRGVADAMLPHLRDRPLALQRFPDGADGPGFFQKQRPDGAPDWVPGVEVPRESEGGTITMVCCRDTATLEWFADQAVLTVHPWLSRVAHPHHPVRLVFDLDPAGDDFGAVRFAARALHELLDELKLPSYPMTTGSRGLHVTVPLAGRDGFDEVRGFARAVADTLAGRHPDRLTTAVRKARRGDRLFLDTLRNAYGQHSVAPYSPRPLPGAPVATPLRWDEVDDPELTARRFTVGNVPDRLSGDGDPWRDIGRHAHGLAAARNALDTLTRDAG